MQDKSARLVEISAVYSLLKNESLLNPTLYKGQLILNVSKAMWALVLVGMGALMTGCVTTSDSSFARKADSAKAEREYVQLGLAYLQQRDFKQAHEYLDRALAINDKSAPALAGYGLLYQSEGESALAEKMFNQALSVDSGFTQGRSYYAAFLYANGRFQAAYDQLTRAVEDTGYAQRSLLFANLAQTALKLGKQDEAVAAYRRALKLNPGDLSALTGLTQLLVEKGRFEEAKPFYNQLVARMRYSETLEQSSASLWLGIRIARHFKDLDQEASLALLLKKRYPNSAEYAQYKAISGHD